jgi:hypothetical protein
MPKTALTRLHDDIDAVRREAFAEGYAAAMQAVREFVSQPPMTGPLSRPAPQAAATAATTAAPQSQPRRLRRGTNAKLVASVLRSIAPRAARPTEIRNALRQEQGVALAFTSIRHALGQLEARQVAEQVAQSKTWRYRGESETA